MRLLVPSSPVRAPLLRHGLQGAAVDTNRRRLALAALAPSRARRSHIGDSGLEAARIDPAPHLLIHRRPREEDRSAATATGSRCAPHNARALNTSRNSCSRCGAVLATSQQIRQHKLSLLVCHITGVPTSRLPISMLNAKLAPAKNLPRFEVRKSLWQHIVIGQAPSSPWPTCMFIGNLCRTQRLCVRHV